jgi:hypothetical protein
MKDENEKQNKWSRVRFLHFEPSSTTINNHLIAICIRFVSLLQTVFCLLGLGLGLVKMYYAFSQAFYPWELQPHTELMGKVTYDAVAIWEFFSGLSFLLIGTKKHYSTRINLLRFGHECAEIICVLCAIVMRLALTKRLSVLYRILC